jgi:hypothetical protein
MELETNYVFGLKALRSLLHFEFNVLAFVQCFVSIGLNRGEVNEHIFAGLPLDKAVTFRCVKPFHNTLLFAQLRYSSAVDLASCWV